MQEHRTFLVKPIGLSIWSTAEQQQETQRKLSSVTLEYTETSLTIFVF